MSPKVAVVFGCVFLTVHAASQSVVEFAINAKWRDIGPYRGGRSCAVSGVPGRQQEFYFGATGGGVWKSTDAGQNWQCVSDGYFKTGSVGAIAVSESNPDIVYVGMGETEIRGNISHGDGVYRSDDGGKTWRHLGLEDTETISRIRIDRKNPDIAWVAALGHIYGPHPDRGIFKTSDGGKTWRKTLFESDRAGAVDLSFNPSDPTVQFAATWEAWRTPFSLNSGGPGSKIWKSTDAGETWKDISRSSGLPGGPLGKVGVAVCASKPNKVYAMIEAAAGGLYVSEDAGATWKLVNANSEMRQRPWYYTRVYADPKNDANVWVLNVAMHRSSDGGATFRSTVARHSDHHDLWIDPTDTNRLISGNDGGATVSIDGGRTWTAQDQPTAQFYHVSTDNSFPYRVLGAQQDNSTVRIPSRTSGIGIASTDWTSTAGGESGYVAAKPNNPDIVFGGSYGGELGMQDHRLNRFRSIDPWPENPMGSGAESLVHRFQWTYPIVFSPHDPNRMYVGSQYVLVSRDDGTSWTRISPDLTRNDKSRQGPSGGPITKDNTSVEYYCTVFTIAESPKRRGVIWAGSDDGLVHVTLNGGRSWKNVTPPDAPEWSLVSMIDASPHDPGWAFVALDNHENDDKRPYIFVTSDYGKSWRRIGQDLPLGSYVRVVRQDPVEPLLLFAGTETGVFVSLDGGSRWSRMAGLPVVPVHDLAIKDGDLIAATHGRSFWILDDLSVLRQVVLAKPADTLLFSPGSAMPVNFSGNGPNPKLGKNPSHGNMVVNYFLANAAQEVRLELLDKEGTVVASVRGNGDKGLNKASLRPQYPGYRRYPWLREWAAGPSPIMAPPGLYTLRLTTDGKTIETQARWNKDPRSPATEKELVAQFELCRAILAKINLANSTVESIRSLRSKIAILTGDDESLKRMAAPFLDGITAVEEAIFQTKAQSGQDFLNYPIRLNNKLSALLGNVQAGAWAPTKQSYDVLTRLSSQLEALVTQYDKLVDRDLRPLLEKLRKP